MSNGSIEELYMQFLGHCRDNELEILASDECVCFSCGSRFSARSVSAWYTDGTKLSASCPKCGMATVVGDSSGLKIDARTVHAVVHSHLEHQTDEERRRELLEFCAYFYDGKFDDNPETEHLYQEYLHELHDDFQEPMASLALARLFYHGLAHTEADVDKAIGFYNDDVLRCDSTALFELGLCYDGRNLRGDARRAFECFSKSAALGSLSASIAIGNYYLQGKYVQRDATFAVSLFLSVFGEMYPKALTTLTNVAEFATTANSIALCLYDGIGCKRNHFRALRYYLLAEYFAELVKERYGMELSWLKETKQVIDHMVVDEFPPSSDTVLFDEDTFFDSFYEQNDCFTLKHLTGVKTEGDFLVINISADRPLLVVDTANGLVETFADMEWRIQGATVLAQNGGIDFERIEFDGQTSAAFYHDDPLLGETVVLRIQFAAYENPSEGDDEDEEEEE